MSGSIQLHITQSSQNVPVLSGPVVQELPAWVSRNFSKTKRIGILADAAVSKRIAGPLQAQLEKAGFSVWSQTVASGEKSKAIQQVVGIYRALSKAGFERGTPLIAIGGGVVGDMVGFVAASYLRGVPYIQVPTTLLAQVDSAIGGKTGVDLPEGKNLVGAFYHPRLIWIDPSLLKTLPIRHWRNGLGEVIKYGAIADASLFNRLEKDMDRIVKGYTPDCDEWILRCAAIKSKIVSEDPFETTGKRALLNFGHTIGHAIEGALGYQHLLHGEAVSIGMFAASYLSEQMGLLPTYDRIRLGTLLTKAGLPSRSTRKISREALLTFLQRDKKAAEGMVRFVLLKKIGLATSGHEIPLELLDTSLSAYGL